jgi:hypothetical protein
VVPGLSLNPSGCELGAFPLYHHHRMDERKEGQRNGPHRGRPTGNGCEWLLRRMGWMMGEWNFRGTVQTWEKESGRIIGGPGRKRRPPSLPLNVEQTSFMFQRQPRMPGAAPKGGRGAA